MTREKLSEPIEINGYPGRWRPDGDQARHRLQMDITGAWVHVEDPGGEYLILRKVNEKLMPELKPGDRIQVVGKRYIVVHTVDPEKAWSFDDTGFCFYEHNRDITEIVRANTLIWHRGDTE